MCCKHCCAPSKSTSYNHNTSFLHALLLLLLLLHYCRAGWGAGCIWLVGLTRQCCLHLVKMCLDSFYGKCFMELGPCTVDPV
jgi:hypothetical protein